MRMSRFITLALGLGTLWIAGCAGYHSFPKSDAASQRVHGAITAQSLTVQRDESLSDTERDQRLRYLAELIKKFNEFDGERSLLYGEKLTPTEARQLDAAVSAMYRIFETLAMFPGRLDKEGEPANAATAEVLDETDVPEMPTE